MSFLTPLYLLGALAVALPILAHLIRRTPPRRLEFSSVMMLAPSLPKVTRRSRIEHWLLLCLRALVIGLLAVAFARPLWRTQVIADEPTEGRWAAVLLDTSGSMRRGGLWEEAQRRFNEVLSEYGPADRVGVFTFDRVPELVWSWDAWNSQDPAQRVAVVTAEVGDKRPGWGETNLAQALMTAAETLDNESSREAPKAEREIVVITDFQSGSRLDALQGYAWPEGIPVRVERVGADASPNNAAAQPAASTDGTVRVRVTNVDGATAETFQLRWETAAASETTVAAASSSRDAPPEPPPADLVVPAGQSRIVRAPAAPAGVATGTLLLVGDEQPFDNRCYVAVPQRQRAAIACIGSDDASDPAEQRFYVGPLFSDTAERDIEIVDWSEDQKEAPTADAPLRLVLLLDRPAASQLPALRKYLQDGGMMIQVLRTLEAAADLAALAGFNTLTAAEANVQGFSLLTDIDFGHPALAAFADPKYSDFTTLHFWKHRRLDVSDLANLRVLARFDDGDLAIGELPVGSGRIVFFTSGWSRADSQLAIWSKFVPLMNALFESTLRPAAEHQRLVVGDALPWQRFATAAEPKWKLTGPEGTAETLSEPAIEKRAERPGFYQLTNREGQAPVAVWAVNLPPSESETTPMGLEQLEALGAVVKQGVVESKAAPVSAETRQNVANAELERRQRLWRWALVAALGLLVAETVLAGWMSRRRAAE